MGVGVDRDHFDIDRQDHAVLPDVFLLPRRDVDPHQNPEERRHRHDRPWPGRRLVRAMEAQRRAILLRRLAVLVIVDLQDQVGAFGQEPGQTVAERRRVRAQIPAAEVAHVPIGPAHAVITGGGIGGVGTAGFAAGIEEIENVMNHARRPGLELEGVDPRVLGEIQRDDKVAIDVRSLDRHGISLGRLRDKIGGPQLPAFRELWRRGQLVQRGEIRIQKRVIRRIELHEAAIVPDKIRGEAASFFRHRESQFAVEERECPAFLDHRDDRVEPEPLRDEFVGGLPGAWVRQHAARRRFDSRSRVKCAAFGRHDQRLVRHRIPKHVGKPRRAHIRTQLRGSRRFRAIQEGRRLQHRLHRQFRFALPVQRAVSCQFFRRQRPAKRTLAKVAHELWTWVAPFPIRRQLLRRRRVVIGQDRRNTLSLILRLEAVDKIFDRELARGKCAVAQQIADGVIVLRMGQPPEHGLRSRGPRIRASRHRRGRHQMIHPPPQRGFFWRSRLEARPAAMFHSHRRLGQQQRFFWLARIDQCPQPVAKALHFIGRRAFFREYQPRSGCHTIGLMAPRAIGLLEQWHHVANKRRLLGR